ncbi:BOLA class I histocompatibility antigen, alpha chain BL3-7-like isoform X1, partial [Clarias magur]
KHSLLYKHRLVSPGGPFTAVGLMNGEEFFKYDSTSGNISLKNNWIMEVEPANSSFWERETSNLQDEHEWFKHQLPVLVSVHQGNNSLVRKYGCELNDNNNQSHIYDHFLLNGEHIFSLDLKTTSWKSTKDHETGIKDWNPGNKHAGYWLQFLEETCCERLKRYLEHFIST